MNPQIHPIWLYNHPLYCLPFHLDELKSYPLISVAL